MSPCLDSSLDSLENSFKTKSSKENTEQSLKKISQHTVLGKQWAIFYVVFASSALHYAIPILPASVSS